jgi:60 kDa SS-A/Ro ribonucleoprotein
MSKFNTPAPTKNIKTVNKAGGSAFKMSDELELVSAVLNSFLKDSFYESGNARTDRIAELVAAVDPHFAAQVALVARNEYGMRSTSHVIAGELAPYASGTEWAKKFYEAIVHRPDDMMEIFAYFNAKTGKKSHAMWKGFAAALANMDSYQLAKYRKGDKAVKLVDIVNLARPHPTEAINDLVNDKLRNTETWEAKISAAGSDEDAKSKEWANLVTSGKIAQFALLRNLRNILENAPEVIDEAIVLLTDDNRIRKSLILPFRYATALNQIEAISGVNPTAVRKVISALSVALDKSAVNIPKFDGDTLIAIDTSGSMGGGWGALTGDEPIVKASLFGALLAKSNNADVMNWDVTSGYVHFDPSNSTLSIAEKIRSGNRGGGTNMSIVFQEANRKYDRIVILTDMESWAHNYGDNPPAALAKYRTRFGADPFVYSWDLAGNGTLQFPERNVATLAGWSEKVFQIMKLVETDKQALVKKIKETEI